MNEGESNEKGQSRNGHIRARDTRKQKSRAIAKTTSKHRYDRRPTTKWGWQAQKYAEALSRRQLQQLAQDLGLPPESLIALGIGWRDTDQGGGYTFPEFDANGQVIGISTRSLAGESKLLKGSHRGLYLPIGWRKRTGPIFVAEGPTDTAALTAFDFAGIGRTSAGGGADLLAQVLRDNRPKRSIIVFGKRDTPSNGSWKGRDGAIAVFRKLLRALPHKIDWMLSPYGSKNLCEFYNNSQSRSKKHDRIASRSTTGGDTVNYHEGVGK